jgi:Tol biopolymer transport system component
MIAQDLETGRRELLGPGVNPFYSPSGHIVYQADLFASGLWALPFSLDTLRATGEAFPIAPNGRNATVASDGTLAYLDTSATQERWVWLDRRGEKTGEMGQVQERRDFPGLYLSPNGQFVAFVATQGSSNHDLWIRHIGSGVRTRLTSDPARDVLPVWSPTGEQLAFSSFRSGNFDVLLRQADGTGEAIALVATPRDEFVTDWSRDGKYLFYVVDGPKTGEDIWYLESKEDGSGWEPNPFLQMPSNQTVPKLSPDGRYVVYGSEESGRREIYVQSFPEGGRKITVSSNGGVQPRWSRDGKELFYVEGSSLMAVAVSTVPSFSLGPAKRLFEHPSFTANPVPQYDVSADGERFLVAEPVGEPAIRIVQNWFAEFKDREQD